MAALTVACTLLVILLPGLVVGFAAGLRGWLLAGFAPLLSYAVAGLCGPWFGELDVDFNLWTFGLAAGVFAAVGLGLRRRVNVTSRHSYRPNVTLTQAPWPRAARLAVAGCLAVGAAVGMYAVWRGMGRLDAIPQDWDAAFHANGIRYIAETGDGGLYGMSGVNKYGNGEALYYPNGYHLLAALTYDITGASIPAVLNANSVLLPGLLALSMVTLVRAFRGRAMLAATVALVAVAPATLLYASMARGPLLPFLLGLALLPLGAVALHRYLQRPAPDTGFLLTLTAVGLLVIHPSTLLAGVLFALPMLVQRWTSAGRRIGRDLVALVAVAVPCAVVAMLHLYGALWRPAEGGPMQWPLMHDLRSAAGALLVFQHDQPQPQLWLTGALLLGVAFAGRLGGLRWVAGTAVLTGVMWLVVATSDTQVVIDLSQPWWNDPWRFIAMAALPLTLLAAHGLAELQAWLRDRLPALSRRNAGPAGTEPSARGQEDVEMPVRTGLAWAAAAAVLLVFTAGSQLLYSGQNAAVVASGYGGYGGYGGEKVQVSADEARAMQALGRLADEDEWAMNDRWDGTVWTYALGGVRTVAAHYDEVQLADDAYLLGGHFRNYRNDPAVRAAVERLNVRWVIVGKRGFIRDKLRSPGLAGYDRLPFLRKVYENRGAAIYRIEPVTPVVPQPAG